MDLYHYLSEECGMKDPKFYILNKPISNIPEIVWDSTRASYVAQLKDWYYSDGPVDDKQIILQGEILAASSAYDNKYILIDLFLKTASKAIPLIELHDVSEELIEISDTVSILLAFPEPKSRHSYLTQEYASIIQYSVLCLGNRVNIRTEDYASISGKIIDSQYIDFKLYFVLEHDSSGLATNPIRFGITNFISLIMANRSSQNNTAIQREQLKLFNNRDHSNSNNGQNSFDQKVPNSAPADMTAKPNFTQPSSQVSSNQHTGEAQWNPLQQAGADSVPLNEGRVELNNYGISEGCIVKVKLQEGMYEGIIVWTGEFIKLRNTMWTLIETVKPRERPDEEESNGIKYGIKMGNVKHGHGLFIPAKSLTLIPDGIRCSHLPLTSITGSPNRFDPLSASIIKAGFVPPIKNITEIIGLKKGIQGLDNSCYMDASLFGMFCFNEMLDDIFLKNSQETKTEDTSERYQVVQKILKERIVYPLRKEGFVRADQILLLRYKLDEAGVVDGLLGKEKDPEEFLTCLLQHVLNVQPYLKIRGTRHEDGFFFQIFTHRRPYINLPSVQLLLEHAFREDNLMLAEVPQFFLIQMPRDGKHFRLYPHILPSLTLDISNITQSVYSPNCILCKKPASYRCAECEKGELYDYRNVFIHYCKVCVGFHRSQTTHCPEEVKFERKHHGPPSQMTLFAVLTIEIGHYVCFAKCGRNTKDWVMFDSMHDRIEDGKSSRNVPNVMAVPDLEEWLSDPNLLCKVSDLDSKKTVPEHIRRLARDVYICMYYSEDNKMF